MNRSFVIAAAAISVFGLGSAVSFAASKTNIDEDVAKSLADFDALNPSNPGLARRAAGMLVFPHITKGGVGVAGEFGEGVLKVKGKTVGYYSIGGGSVGLTLGLAKRAEIIMFMTQDALETFTHTDGWSIGADAGVTVVSKNAGADYDSLTHNTPIIAFAYGEKGLIGDLSVQGSKITKIKD
ncbi:MAG: lipid-binding SYLF domain-containing protein [Gammaproteobacteria bacterium]